MAKAKTFVGGIHPAYSKELTHRLPIQVARPPKVVIIPMSQHSGAPCNPVVKIGEQVKMGQVIGISEAFVSAMVHSSVSGKVKAIEKRPLPNGQDGVAVIIENDFTDEAAPALATKRPAELTAAEIKQLIKEAGIVGMGGGAFPTHVKLSPPSEAKLDAVIINGAECEPYLTCDHRVMVEKADEVLAGLKLIMKAVGVDKGYIGIEDNKQDAIERLRELTQSEVNIEIVPLHVKYPQGGELQLIKAILGREVPSGKLPFDVGVIVNNVGTALAIYEAVTAGKPLIERVVTVTGSMLKEPMNLLVRIGTIFADVLEQCGLIGAPGKVISGGPMMGRAQHTLEVPVTKAVSGILVLSDAEATTFEEGPCIRCGRCIDVCPMFIQPIHIAQAVERKQFDRAGEFHAMDCRECGSCSYICPARKPLLQQIRLAKSALWAKNRKN